VRGAARYRDFEAKLRNPMILPREFEYVHTFAATAVRQLRLLITRASGEDGQTILRRIEVFEPAR